MNWKKIKVVVLPGIFLLILLWGYTFLGKDYLFSKDYQLEVIQVNDGYGYQILYKKKIVVYQPFIPAVSGEKKFSTKDDAESVGRLVLKKIKEKQDFSISLTELRQLDIE